LEAGPCEDPSGLQCAFDRFCWEFTDLTSPFQTQLVIDTHMAVGDTQRGVADAQRGIENTQTMVADIHRRVLTGQEPTSGQSNSVSQLAIHQHQNSYNCLDPSKVSDTEYCGGLRSYVSVASPLVNYLPRRRGTVSDVTS
jgi:hypothetical protein